MHTVLLVGFTPDLNSAALITLIRNYSDMSLQASTKEVDRLMSGGTVSLLFDNLSEARSFALDAETLGAVVGL